MLSTFSFASPAYLFLLPVAFVLWLGLWRYRRGVRRQASRLGEADLVLALRRGGGSKGMWGDSLLIAALCFIVLALARPRFGLGEAQWAQAGLQTVVMVDVSPSMLTQDVKPSRLESTQRLVSALVDARASDRFALGIFSGNATLQLPLTADRSALRSRLAALSPSLLSSQGTNLSEALRIANAALSTAHEGGKTVIVITDGENHEPGAAYAASQLREADIHLFIVGVGTPQGGTIPTAEGPLRDADNQIVVSRLQPDTLALLAKESGGKWFEHTANADALAPLLDALKEVQQTDTTLRYAAYRELFPACILMALLCLLLLALPKGFFTRRKREASATATLLALWLVPQAAGAQTSADVALNKAQEAFAERHYDVAAMLYQQAVEADPRNAASISNLGTSLLHDGHTDEAIKRLKEASLAAPDKPTKAHAAYNLGCALYAQYAKSQQADEATLKQLREAAEAFKEALRQNPHDEDARYNLALCIEKLKQQQQQQQQEQQQQRSQADSSQENQPPPQNDEQLLNLVRNEEERTRARAEALPPQEQRRQKYW
ncbi:MAG: VWA domain-containing protein [Alloprevotella sp.]|nr:VWA domain-containing protein [Alloprevotella sp.]